MRSAAAQWVSRQPFAAVGGFFIAGMFTVEIHCIPGFPVQ